MEGVRVEEASDERPRRSRRRRVALAAALVLVAALVVLWIVRKPIAEHYVDGTLAAAHVPARYTIADLGLGGQRLTNVVIGDPAAPDLVADWIETRTRFTLTGPELSGVRAGRVRVRGRLADGNLSLGTIDRLLPQSTGGAFSLPKLDLSVDDGGMRLETPYGFAGLALSGSGRLDDGFDGKLAVISERLATGGCAGDRLAVALRVRSGRRGIAFDGPANVASAACGGVRVAQLHSDLTGNVVLGAQSGSSMTVRLVTGAAGHPRARADSVAGTLAFLHQGGRDMTVRIDLAATQVRGFGARAARVALDGGVEARGGAFSYAGKVAIGDADAAALVPRYGGIAVGTPVAPVIDRIATASVEAARRFSGEAEVGLFRGDDVRLSIRDATLRSASGARLAFQSGSVVEWRSPGALSLDGGVTMAGGGLPDLKARGVRTASGAIRATLAMAPYAAGGASLALTPVTVAGGRIVARATLSGPLGDGRVEGLTMPLDVRVGDGGIAINPGCAPLVVRHLEVSGLAIGAARLGVCPIDGAMVRLGTRLGGGVQLAGGQIDGLLGQAPVTLGFDRAIIILADRAFSIAAPKLRIGPTGRETRFAFGALWGLIADGAASGYFAKGAGQIGNVPLLLSDAAGDWRFADGVLRLTGALAVSDAQTATPRFQPMQARDVSLSLVNGAIAAKGTLYEPTTGTRVADVAIRHALGPGIGSADLTVPALAFAKGFQPELLTRLTFGVIADVRGTVSGEGHIAWSPSGVTSTGAFRTAGTDLAAAFGPVTGIATEIRFTDLLSLQSAPNQVATIKSLNPGIAVPDGTIRYQTLADARVRVEGGAWPFAGGRLTLDPTLLDFSQAALRRMTFRVDGAAADRFLQQFDFKNLDATGTFDGVLPMVFDDSGGRIEAGHMAVREGGGTIRYVGEIGEKDVGFWGNLAFQALKSLRYRSLTLTMNGPLAGEMVTDVRFAGVSQGEGAKGNFIVRRLQRLPFVFNVRIKAPFRGLLDSAQSFYDPRRLIQRNLPALLEAQDKRVQPPASDPVPHKD